MTQKQIFLITFLIFIGILFWISQKPKLESFVSLKIGNTTIQAELADTPEKRVQGLSGRDKLGENEGMLFVFDSSSTTSDSEVVLDKPSRHGIWMKDMKFPIDIIWARPVRDRAHADAPEGPVGRAISNGVKFNLQIVDISENISPDTYPQVFKPQEPASYVLEIDAGFAAAHGVSVSGILEIK